jgi:hypothetical protein
MRQHPGFGDRDFDRARAVGGRVASPGPGLKSVTERRFLVSAYMVLLGAVGPMWPGVLGVIGLLAVSTPFAAQLPE